MAITLPTASTFTSGDPIAVTATATDDRSVSQILFRLGSNSSIDTNAPYQWSTFVPSVATATDLELRAEATDAAGNLAVATKALHVQPLAPTTPPTVAFLYPGAGALLPIGIGVDLQIQATDDRGVERVELYVDGAATPLTVLTASPYTYHLNAPAGAVDGQILNLRAVAYDYSRQTAEATVPVRVIQPATVISSGKTLDTTDTSLDGTSVVVAGGTLVVTGPHTFRDLVVLNGANVVHLWTSPTQEYHLDLTIQRDFFVAQGGKIDVTGRGYPGSPSISQRSYAYGNVQTEGAAAGVGGSYGGRGGLFDGSSPIYGSFYDPADPGAGGGATSSSGGSTGGGVVRVTASGNVVVDGDDPRQRRRRLRRRWRGGLDPPQRRGHPGRRLDPGGGSAGYGAAGGSGGRIALYAATIDSGLVTRVQAPGGKTSSINAATWGAAGTVFVKPDSQLFGDLILDNAGNRLAPAHRAAAGRQRHRGRGLHHDFTDNEADFRHVLGAADVVLQRRLRPPLRHRRQRSPRHPLTLQVPAPAALGGGARRRFLPGALPLQPGGRPRRRAGDRPRPGDADLAQHAGGRERLDLDVRVRAAGDPDHQPGGGRGLHLGQHLHGGREPAGRPRAFATCSSCSTARAPPLTSTPYSWSLVAPEVTQGTDLPLAFTATDLSGNRFTAARTVHVDPAVDPSAPVVTLANCHATGAPANAVNSGDLVAPGVAVAIPFVATDNQAVQSYSLVVNGTTVQTVGNLNQATRLGQPGLDAAGECCRGIDLQPPRRSSRLLGGSGLRSADPFGADGIAPDWHPEPHLGGQRTVARAGSRDLHVQQPLSLASLTLLSGARVTGLSGGTASIATSGAMTLQCGAVLDMSALGYAGGATATSPGSAPSGVTGSASDSGGSHGGSGQVWGNPGPAGPVYDSVYQPQLGGGGGSLRNTSTGRHGGNGGGVLTLNVGQLVLNGQILAKGEQRATSGSTDSSGAGGSVSITAGTLSGAGLIDASGGDYQASSQYGGSGGGGRVLLNVVTFSGFDPVAQVKAWGGTIWNVTTPLLYAGPGTVFVKTSGDTYGRLIVDSGKETSGAERVGPQTPLPVLGTGAVTAFLVQGADGLVTASAAFKAQWLGAWMALLDSTGAPLGSFQVQSIDGSGRALLKGAGSVTGASQYRGQYRFDRVDLKSGAGITSGDDLLVGDVYAESKGRLPSTLTATNVTIKAGASPVTVAQGGTLSLAVSGTLTVETGAVLDMSALGYAGGATATSPGSAPSGVTGSASDSGGSHGGAGQVWGNPGPAGPVYDSVYQPQLGGGGGSLRNTATGRHGGSGGGVLTLNVGQLVLNGRILAKGEQRATSGSTDSSGAGGSVSITAGTLSGAGLIDASGGDYQASTQYGASGGGGRVVLNVGTLSGFDPVAQVKAWGGTTWNVTTPLLYAGPGTVFVKTPADTYGRLIVDSGKETSGAERVGPQTPLPVLGTGAVTAFLVQGADGLVTASAAFKAQWLGAWMALLDPTGAPLGSFQVQSIDGSGRALLKGAGSITGASKYRGQYRFDRVDLKSGAGITSGDDLLVGDVYAESKGRLPSTLTATNVTIKAGTSPVTVAQGGTLALTVSGTLTVETGATLDVSALGYAGGATATSPGSAPSGVTGSASDSGGSHGGSGQVWGNPGPAGPVYDSVYQPQLGGGGGSLRNTSTGRHGGNGGGVLTLNVGQLVLNGQILAKGEQRATSGSTDSSGAGGSVSITAGTLSGAGLIDASGGDYQASTQYGGSGGGGRVVLNVGTLSGFDPVAQVKAWGGTIWNVTTPLLYAGPGTVFVKTSGDTYGRLIVDSGKETSGAERMGPQTPLPSLGTGAVTAFQAQGADAWVTASAAFKAQWLGAWMALLDSTGAPLGSFQVQSIDGAGRALLKGAGSVTGATQYRGQYRFDRVDLKSGAGVSSGDDVLAGDVYAESKGRLPSTLTATNVTIKAGASPVTVAQGGTLAMTVSGTLTVESGAVLDVSVLGYAGGPTSGSPGIAPTGVTAAASDAGGSHGGMGALGSTAGPAGDIYDSVYQPQLGGGGGSLRLAATGRHGGNGGGLLMLNVGQLVLNGQILAKGEQRTSVGNSDASGAGGSVVITVDTLSGTGLIDVSGGSYNAQSQAGGAGGAGRVALYVGSFSGFDPVSQVKTWGGTVLSNTTVTRYASPGTLFVKLPSQTYGKLYVDQGGIVAGKPIPNTTLPSIGVGTVGTATADTVTPTALWIVPSDANAKFALGTIGMWVRVNGTDYRVLDQTADRRQLLLAGALGAVHTGDSYRGVYKFDEVIVHGGAKLEFRDTNVVGTFTVDSTSSVIQNVP